MKHSAGTLLYRGKLPEIEVLLVHPSGNFNRRAPWSIPKGETGENEVDLEITARRETLEETGIQPEALTSLGHIDYKKSRKRVHCFAGPAPLDSTPRCASWEVDQAQFVALDDARKLLHPDQVAFLDRLLDFLSKEQSPPV